MQHNRDNVKYTFIGGCVRKKIRFMNTFSRICERTSPQPVKSFVAGQAIDLKTLIQRFERGQRLNVHQNFRPMSNFTEGSLYVEDFEDAPPENIHDVVDVEEHYREHQERKKEFAKRKKEAQQGKDVSKDEPKQATDSPAPVDSNLSE